MIIRPGNITDMAGLQELFVGTVTGVCNADYDERQVEAWFSGVSDEQRWIDIMTNQFVVVAEIDSQIAGFGTLADGSYIDMFYVHKDHQRRAVGKALYEAVEVEVRRCGFTRITANVSITAMRFFERMGFEVLGKQAVQRNGVELTNYQMMKSLYY